MPEQSIASYISNLTSLGIMILIALFLFLLIFIISKILIRVNLKRMDHGEIKDSRNIANREVILKKDPNIFINIAALGVFFLLGIIFVLLVLFFLIFSDMIKITLSLYFIAFALIFIISASVYIVKSRIFK